MRFNPLSKLKAKVTTIKDKNDDKFTKVEIAKPITVAESAKMINDVEDLEHYSVEVSCKNCKYNQPIKIKKGKRVFDEIRDLLCINCRTQELIQI